MLEIGKNLGVIHNVAFRIIDEKSGKVLRTHVGHNSATSTLIEGIAHFLIGEGSFDQGSYMLKDYIPQFMSLGTMGLYGEIGVSGQSEDVDGLPIGLGALDADGKPVDPLICDEVIQNYMTYAKQIPGFGADGTSSSRNNNRKYSGLGPLFSGNSYDASMLDGFELLTSGGVRLPILHKEVIAEPSAELPNTYDVIFSSMMSTGALSRYRYGAETAGEEPTDLGHIFISEAGLWSRNTFLTDDYDGNNGLLAGYRIMPPNSDNWTMGPESGLQEDDTPEYAANRKLLQRSILRVGVNQIVQIIWKIQIGAIDDIIV